MFASGAWLDALPPDRREPVVAFLSEVVGQCPYCEQDVTRTTPRGIDCDERVGCLECVTAVVGKCALCRHDITRQHKHEQADKGLAHLKCAERRRSR